MLSRTSSRLGLLLLTIAHLVSFSSGGESIGFQSPADDYLSILKLLARKEYAQAIEESKRLIGRSPEFAKAYQKLVIASRKVGQLDQTKTYLKSLLDQSPPNPRAHYALGLANSEEGNQS